MLPKVCSACDLRPDPVPDDGRCPQCRGPLQVSLLAAAAAAQPELTAGPPAALPAPAEAPTSPREWERLGLAFGAVLCGVMVTAYGLIGGAEALTVTSAFAGMLLFGPVGALLGALYGLQTGLSPGMLLLSGFRRDNPVANAISLTKGFSAFGVVLGGLAGWWTLSRMAEHAAAIAWCGGAGAMVAGGLAGAIMGRFYGEVQKAERHMEQVERGRSRLTGRLREPD